MIETYVVNLTADEIESLIDLNYYGGEHILSTWDDSDWEPLMKDVNRAIRKMRIAWGDK